MEVRPASTLLALTAALLSCSRAVPTLEECKKLGQVQAVIERCYGGNLERGTYIGDLNCFPFSAPKHLKGIWITQTEVSDFYVEPEQITSAMLAGGGDTWLEAVGAAKPTFDAAWKGGPGVFQIELVGRQSLCPTGYGHVDMSKNEVVAEQIISLVRLRDPRMTNGR